MKAKEWDKAIELRGRSFSRNLETYKMLTRLKPVVDPNMVREIIIVCYLFGDCLIYLWFIIKFW